MIDTVNAFGFLFSFVQNVLALIFLARLAFQWAGVPMQNPIAQFVLRFTQPIVGPLQKIFPTIKRFNTAALVAVLAINILFVVGYFFLTGANASWYLLATLAVTSLLQQALDFLFWAIIIQVVFSWLPNAGFHPLAQITYPITAPILQPLQKILPHFGGIDFSPIIAIVAIKFIEILLLGH